MAKFTVEQLNGQYEGTLREFISNPDNWRRFLDTAARMYKYDFRTQVLIFSQRPSACACADFDFWTRRAQRSVKRGSSGVGIVSEERGKARVSYLFDVTDTVPRKENIPPPYIWSLREEAQENTLQALSDVTGEDTHVSGTFAVDLFVAAQVAASRIASKQSSDPVFLRAAMSSAAWCVLRRCGIDPSPLVRGIPVDQFDPSQLAQMGSIVQQSANTVLRVVEQTVRQLEGRKIHQVKLQNHLAEQVSVMYNKSKESAGKLAEKGADEHERTGESDTGERDVPHGDGRQAVPRPDAEGVRPVRRGASAGADAVRSRAVSGAGRSGRAERLSERHGAAGTGGAGADRAGDGAEGRDGRSAQGARPDEMGEADEQLPSLRGGDRPTELVVGQDADKAAERSAAFAFSDSEGEQLSLSLYGDAERRWDAPHRKSRAKPQTAAPAEDVFQKNTSDVFDWNTPDVTGDVIDRLLTAGGNEMHSRERIAAFFLQDRFEPEDAADFLRREYGTGGKGVRVDGVDYSLWFDKDGLRIARGHDTRTARAVTLSYADVAERIDRLLQDGHYASAAQLADARPNEYREIASDIWYVYHDRDKSADSRGFFTRTAALIKGGYPDAVARIADALSDPVQRAALTAELSAFTAAAQTDSSLYRFRYIRTRAAQTVERLQRTERMNKGYTAENGFEPSRPSFITQDEIDHMLCGGSHVDGGKHRIYSFLTDNHTTKERIDFIKDKYGTGGYSHAGYDEWHDSAGISLKRADEMAVYDTIKLSWSQVEQRLGTLIRQGRYMTADEIEQYERSRTDTVRLTEESPTGDVFRANTQKGEEQTSNQSPKDERFQPNIQDLYNKYKPMVAAAVSTDESYCNACRNADRENAYLEGGAAIKRAVDSMGDMQLTKLYYDMTVFHNRLHKEVLDETYSILAMHVENSENVQMRESEGEYCYRYTNKNSPMSDWGHAMFVDDEESSEEYGRENPVRFKVNRERLVDIVDFRDEIIHKLEEQYENGTLPAGIDSIIEFGCTIEEIVRDFNPTDIVMNAAAWDNDDLTMWFYENIAEPHGVYGFKTEDGAIVFDENLIESEENPMQWMKPVADDIQVDTSKEQISSASDSEEAAQSAAADLANDVFHGNTSETDIHGIKEYSFEYQLLDRLRTDCNYFLGAGGRSEKHLWAGSVYAQIAKMRELYGLLPEKPEWLTKEAIDSYAERMAPRYLVVVYHHSENGFDEKLDYQTLAEAEKAAQGYVAGTMEMDGFAYDGAAVYDQQEHKYLRIFGKYPDQAAQSDAAALANDVFHGNTLEEAVQSAATDLVHDVFQKNTSDASAGAVPIIRCEWSESAVFEDGKEYSVAEFDRLMKQADDEYVAGKNAAMQKYGTWQQWYDADDPYFARFLGYDKTKFTLILPDGRTFTERQDIGDGDGGVLDFLSQYDQYRDIVPLLRRVVDAERDVFHGNTLAEAAQSAAADPAHDVFHGNTLAEAAQSAATDLAHDVFHGNTLEEAAQSAAADPAHDVFHGNTLEEAAQSAGNFRITDGQLGVSTPKVRYTNNVASIALLKQLEAEDRPATSEEQMVLARYTGWGAIPQAFDAANTSWSAEYAALKELLTDEEYRAARASTLNAHYTSPTVIRAIYEAVGRMGFHGGTILEPSMGVGNFFGLLPEQMWDSRLYGVELDSITGRIAQKLYPNANITVDGFENTRLADDTFDLAVGNIPFGDYKVQDKQYDKHNLLIHDYFIAKTLDKVHPGGIVAMLTSKGTLDKADPKARRLLAEKADLLGAIRLPNNAFKANAGTRVTADILFLQKRDTPPEQLPAWVEIGQTADGLSLNRYFLDHPEMVLGKMTTENTQYGHDTTCAPLPDAVLEDLLQTAVRQLGHENVFQKNTQMALAADVFQKNTQAETLRPYSYFVQDGKLLFKGADEVREAALNATATKRAIGMVGVRDATRQLIEAQKDGCSDAQLVTLQDNLGRLYDAFVKEFGVIRSQGNRLAFSKDAGYPLLLALEMLDEEQRVVGKSAIFTRRTIRPHIAADRADTPEDALGLSLSERGQIDLGYMSDLLGGMTEQEIITALQGQIFREPASGIWQPADEYLSGNVRRKLDEARAAAQADDAFAINVQMLERVQPAPLTAADISVRLGATWIPASDIGQFVREVLHPPYYAKDKIGVVYSDALKRWHVSGKSYDRDIHGLAYTKFGTSRVSGYELLELSLNLRDVQIMDVKFEGGKEKRIPNPKETIKARSKQDALRQAFKDWIFADPERRERLVGYYNEHFNTTRPRIFDGAHLTLPGINPEIKLRKHQTDAIARILYSGNTLLAHTVGAGKTWTMAAAAMELRRLGLAHKPMFVVPNGLTDQWGAEFQQLYPGANILVATEKDFETKNRKEFCARIATGDYDAVIIAHSQFEKLPLSPENERAHIEKQIDMLELSISEASGNKDLRYSVKQLESSKQKLKLRLKKLMEAKVKDDVVTFEELGVDRLFVDEADEFKNLALHTKMRNVGGINTSAAQKSEDMMAKCEYLNEKSGYNSVVFATGTPISNSMTELYTMMRYLQYDVLEEIGMTDFDSWASNFGETVTAMELAPEGTGYRSKTRFAKFCNLPELISLWRQAADIQTADMLDLPRPEVEYHNVKAQPTQEQRDMVQHLGKRADAVRKGAVSPYEDNMLAITDDGRKLALDQRLADPSLPDDPNSKVNSIVHNVYDIWARTREDRGTQIIFCDLGTPAAKGKGESRFCVYDDIRDKLIARGVPAEEIAYIHDANTTQQKAALRNKVNAGSIRVLIGSTRKMGAGFNVQKRLIAEHHADCPWRPRDVEQREGRILRQGNDNKKVEIYRYVTEGTFDSFNWVRHEVA